MIGYIIKRDGRIVPFRKDKIIFAIYQAAVAVGGRDRSIAESIAEDVAAALEKRYEQENRQYPTVEEVQDTVEKVLIEHGHARTAKAYILYRYEHTLKRQGRRSLTYSSENIPYKKLWEALTWSIDKGCMSLQDIRGTIESGNFTELIKISEDFYKQEIENALSLIREYEDKLKVIIIAGPSSSGKTTTTKKIAEYLETENRTLVPINVDNYFYDKDSHPQSPEGDYDYETPQALDLELFNKHLSDLLSGREIDVPFYNFKKGQRDGSSGTLSVKKGDILLIDCLHGLYEPLTESVPDEKKFKLYIETLSQIKEESGRFIRWADIRMLRRMVRDMQFRGYNPKETLLHWYLVRRSELRYIIPQLPEADAIVNSFLPYELPILKSRLEGYIRDFSRELKDNPERQDAYSRTLRVLRMFREIPSWTDESAVPNRSLLREFIGGSDYTY